MNPFGKSAGADAAGAGVADDVCERCQTPVARLQTLMDAAEGAVNFPATFGAGRARRTLAGICATCAACAARVASWRAGDNAVRALYAAEVPTARTYQNALYAVALADASAKTVTPTKTRRAALPLRPLFTMGFAVAGVAALGWAVLRTPGAPLNPTISWAQVEQAMATTVKTVRWVTRTTHYDERGVEQRYVVTDRYARLDPPALTWRMRPDETRLEGVRGREIRRPGHISRIGYDDAVETPETYTLYDHDERKLTRTFRRQAASTSKSIVNAPRPAARLRARILYSISAPGTSAKVTTSESRPDMGSWSSAPAILNGQAVVKLTYLGPLWFGRRETRLVWADEETRRILRTESRLTFPNSSKIESLNITEGFIYNAPLPSNIFTIQAPPGVVIADEDERENKPAPLSKADRADIDAFLNQMDQGWRRRNFDQFAKGWDFAYFSRVVPGAKNASGRRQEWRARVENHDPAAHGFAGRINGKASEQNYFGWLTPMRRGADFVISVPIRSEEGAPMSRSGGRIKPAAWKLFLRRDTETNRLRVVYVAWQ